MSNEQTTRGLRYAQLVGLELKASFARLQISQTQVADGLGHSRSGYSKWINAKPSMPMEALINTCEFIGVNPCEILNAAYRRLIEEMGEYAPSVGTSPVVDGMDDDERRIAEAVDIAKTDPMQLAAYRDGHKHDPDPDASA